MVIYPNRIAEELAKGLKPCYMVFGDEPQQKLEVLDAIRKKARTSGFTERTLLVADKEFNWSELVEASQTLSLFSSVQLIELELPTGKPGSEGSKTLQKLAPLLGRDLLLIVHGPRIGKDVQKAKWFTALDAVGVHSLCYPLEGKQLHSWIQAQLASFQLQAEPECIKIIADYCEGNLLAARQEIEKLSLLYPQQILNLANVESAMVDQSRFNVFQLVDVMLSGDQKRCVKMLYRLESEGIEPNIVIWALIREWQTLWALKMQMQNGQAIQWQRHGIWKNRQSAYQAALSRLSVEHLETLLEQLQIADLAFKQSVIVRPFVKLCHLCMLFLGVPVHTIPLME